MDRHLKTLIKQAKKGYFDVFKLNDFIFEHGASIRTINTTYKIYNLKNTGIVFMGGNERFRGHSHNGSPYIFNCDFIISQGKIYKTSDIDNSTLKNKLKGIMKDNENITLEYLGLPCTFFMNEKEILEHVQKYRKRNDMKYSNMMEGMKPKHLKKKPKRVRRKKIKITDEWGYSNLNRITYSQNVIINGQRYCAYDINSCNDYSFTIDTDGSLELEINYDEFEINHDEILPNPSMQEQMEIRNSMPCDVEISCNHLEQIEPPTIHIDTNQIQSIEYLREEMESDSQSYRLTIDDFHH